MAFEFTLAQAHLSPIIMIISDDINTNRAFTEMVQSNQELDGVAITQERKRDAAVGIAWQVDPEADRGRK